MPTSMIGLYRGWRSSLVGMNRRNLSYLIFFLSESDFSNVELSDAASASRKPPFLAVGLVDPDFEGGSLPLEDPDTLGSFLLGTP